MSEPSRASKSTVSHASVPTREVEGEGEGEGYRSRLLHRLCRRRPSCRRHRRMLGLHIHIHNHTHNLLRRTLCITTITIIIVIVVNQPSPPSSSSSSIASRSFARLLDSAAARDSLLHAFSLSLVFVPSLDRWLVQRPQAPVVRPRQWRGVACNVPRSMAHHAAAVAGVRW